MTDIMAAIGLVQMQRYPGLLARRRQLIAYYDEALRDCGVQVLGLMVIRIVPAVICT